MPTEHNIIPGGRSHKTLAIGGTGRPLVWRDLWLKPVGPDHHVKHDVRGKFSSPRQKSPVSTSPPTLSCMRTSRQSRPMDFRGRRYRRNTTLEHGRNGDREIGTYSALIRSAHIKNASWRLAQRYRLKRGGRGNHGAIGTVLADRHQRVDVEWRSAVRYSRSPCGRSRRDTRSSRMSSIVPAKHRRSTTRGNLKVARLIQGTQRPIGHERSPSPRFQTAVSRVSVASSVMPLPDSQSFAYRSQGWP
ncbi:hypothetical protein R3P38DRAFT_3480978 [Favolaschia claudopus]|uniref:Uncharacterized protein n=1 Tax=Favolaschia claudopus TaxID=2862362 RepID=A0AAW0CBA6_9AGAR